VAVVDAFDDPNAVSDVSQYRSIFNLGACTALSLSATGCTFTNGATITKVNQNGVQGSYPSGNTGWGQEISLDLDMVSAACPKCNIILVEATDNSLANLGSAVDEAALLGANAISNSYGTGEFCSRRGCETSYDAYYNHPGIAVTASTGDRGFGVQYPAASPYVAAVGGTSLTINGAGTSNPTYGGESAWSGAGSGCSALETQPTWQNIANITGTLNVPGTSVPGAGCTNRAVADVAADADPNTGVDVYDTFGTSSSWAVYGGTSVASPIIASVYALAGNVGKVTNPATYPYANPGALNDVTSGSNGSCGTALCIAVPGWDGPTGLGTPRGIGAF